MTGQGKKNSKRGRVEENEGDPDAFGEFRDKISRKEDLSIKDVASMLLAMHASNEEKQNEILNSTVEIAEKVKITNIRVDDHDRRLINLEMKALAANIILKNVHIHKQAQMEGKEESWSQTKEQVEDAINSLNIKERINIMTCRRFKSGDPSRIAPIQVILGNPLEKRLLFQAVAARKPRFSLDHEYPMALKNELKKLREEAHNMRRASNFTAKFRVEVRGGKPLIVQKSQGESRYTPV